MVKHSFLNSLGQKLKISPTNWKIIIHKKFPCDRTFITVHKSDECLMTDSQEWSRTEGFWS